MLFYSLLIIFYRRRFSSIRENLTISTRTFYVTWVERYLNYSKQSTYSRNQGSASNAARADGTFGRNYWPTSLEPDANGLQASLVGR